MTYLISHTPSISVAHFDDNILRNLIWKNFNLYISHIHIKFLTCHFHKVTKENK